MGVLGPSVDIVGPPAPSSVFAPAIAWQPNRFGIVWAMAETASSEHQIYFDLVDPSDNTHIVDQVLSAVPSGEHAYYSSIAAGLVNPGSGSTAGFGVVWEENTSRIMGAVFSLAGEASSPPQELKGGSSSRPTLSWNGTRFGAAWDTYSAASNVEFRQMNAGGTAYGSILQVTQGSSRDEFPRLVWTPDAFISIWRRDFAAGYFARLPCVYD
jgi:hypothetical protein